MTTSRPRPETAPARIEDTPGVPPALADFFVPRACYFDGDGYKAPEQTHTFQCEHVATHPRPGAGKRAFGFLRNNAPGSDWLSVALGEDDFTRWSRLPTTLTTPPLPIDLEQLPTDELSRLFRAAEEILRGRTTEQLPRMVRDEVREALAKNEPGTPAPVSAAFETTGDYDDGIFWDEENVRVVLTDGTTRDLNLSGPSELPGVLSDHAKDWKPGDRSVLQVVFEPLALNITD
ncbi:hypothetical protein [Streptomyces sp. NPDC015350]|uniref:hypothetical protein n=1 Tax=Streptomyces sp. NPDC015350 TaxID=3364955 RepID=UPI0036F97E55